MFIGHYALAFGAKKLAPTVSLGTLFLAAVFADLLWASLALAGLEKFSIEAGATAAMPLDFVFYPYSHSLLALGFWAVVFAGIRGALRGGWSAAAIVGALVLTHWLLDVLSHRADMPMTPGDTEGIGLGLWNTVPGTLAVEGGLLAAGVTLYVVSTWSNNRSGTIGLWALVAVLAVLELALIFGPQPPSKPAVLWATEATWLLVLAGYWVDANRTVSLRRDSRSPAPRPASASSAHVRRNRAAAKPAARTPRRRY